MANLRIKYRTDAPHQTPLVPKTNSKILRLIQAVDTSMLVAQIGYRLSNDAAALCDPFSPSLLPPQSQSLQQGGRQGVGREGGSRATTPGMAMRGGLGKKEMLQTMACHGHGHCLKAVEGFRDVQQEVYKVRSSSFFFWFPSFADDDGVDDDDVDSSANER